MVTAFLVATFEVTAFLVTTFEVATSRVATSRVATCLGGPFKVVTFEAIACQVKPSMVVAS